MKGTSWVRIAGAARPTEADTPSQRVVRDYNPLADGNRGRSRGREKPGPVPGGIRPLRPPTEARCTRRAPERKTGSILAPPSERPSRGACPSDGVEPGHTPRPRVGRRVRMLLSFQRPSHLFKKGFLLRGTPGSRTGSRGGPMSIARNRRMRSWREEPEYRRSPVHGRSPGNPCMGRKHLYIHRFSLRRGPPPSQESTDRRAAGDARQQSAVDLDEDLQILRSLPHQHELAELSVFGSPVAPSRARPSTIAARLERPHPASCRPGVQTILATPARQRMPNSLAARGWLVQAPELRVAPPPPFGRDGRALRPAPATWGVMRAGALDSRRRLAVEPRSHGPRCELGGDGSLHRQHGSRAVANPGSGALTRSAAGRERARGRPRATADPADDRETPGSWPLRDHAEPGADDRPDLRLLACPRARSVPSLIARSQASGPDLLGTRRSSCRAVSLPRVAPEADQADPDSRPTVRVSAQAQTAAAAVGTRRPARCGSSSVRLPDRRSAPQLTSATERRLRGDCSSVYVLAPPSPTCGSARDGRARRRTADGDGARSGRLRPGSRAAPCATTRGPSSSARPAPLLLACSCSSCVTRRLAPTLFGDDTGARTSSTRSRARRFPALVTNAGSARSADGHAVHSV